MAKLFDWIKIPFRALRRTLTGEIVKQIDLELGGGLALVSWQLKRERKLGDEYVVFVGRAAGGVYYSMLELDEFDRFIRAADEIRSLQTSATMPSAKLNCTSMVATGEVLHRIDTKTLGGLLTFSLRLKRERHTAQEYIVLGTIAPGWYLYYPFELDEFHRFVAAAKRIRASVRSFSSALQPA